MGVIYLIIFGLPQDCNIQLTDEPDKRCYPLGETLLCQVCHLRRLNLHKDDKNVSPRDSGGGGIGGPDSSDGSMNSPSSFTASPLTPSTSQNALYSSKSSVNSQNTQYSQQYNGIRQSPTKTFPQSGNYVNITPVSSTIVNGYSQNHGVISPKMSQGAYPGSPYHITDLWSMLTSGVEIKRQDVFQCCHLLSRWVRGRLSMISVWCGHLVSGSGTCCLFVNANYISVRKGQGMYESVKSASTG